MTVSESEIIHLTRRYLLYLKKEIGGCAAICKTSDVIRKTNIFNEHSSKMLMFFLRHGSVVKRVLSGNC